MGISQSQQDNKLNDDQDLIGDLVTSVLTRKNGSRQWDLPKDRSKSNRINIMADAVDNKRPLKNIATDFVVNEMFQTQETLYKFMDLVYRSFDNALTIYRKRRGLSPLQVFFVYKGGNIMRIISSEFLLELPAYANREISEFYKPFFKRSDADFSIYLDPNVENYDVLFYELALLSYRLQVEMRKEFQNNPTKYFDYAKFNDEYKSSLLEKYLDLFNHVDGFDFDSLVFGNVQYPKNDKTYVSLTDTALRFSSGEYGDPVREGYFVDLEKDDTSFTITYNTALDFTAGKTSRVKFGLVRTKFTFNLYQSNYITPLMIGGELIDVSLPHRYSEGTVHFFDHINQNIMSYKLKYMNCDLTFKSYSLAYLTTDLEKILFIQPDYPWDDNKYAKRINRLFYLYFIDIFISVDGGHNRLSVISDIQKMMIEPIMIGRNNIRSTSVSIGVLLNKYRNGGYENLLFLKLVRYMLDIIAKIPPMYISEFIELAELLNMNINFIMTTIKKVKSYCVTDGKAKISNLTTANSTSLI